MKKILYLHGFASAYKEESEKIQTLKKHFEVVPFSYPTHADYESNMETISTFVTENKIDLLMGCSMGGFYTIQVSSLLNLPGVVLNPAIHLCETLSKYEGECFNFVTEEPFQLTRNTIESYPENCSQTGNCIVFLLLGDELLDSKQSYKELKNNYPCYLLEGGEHRFSKIEMIVPKILSFLHS